MTGYYFRLALRSLRRNPLLTALMVLAIGFGVAASMTTYAVFRAVSGNPLPDKSAQLFVPQIDNWGPASRKSGGDIPDSLSYTDAMALMRAHQAKRQTAIYPVSYTVVPGAGSQPFTVNGYATYTDFFPMFDVPFRYGNGWASEHDTQRANVIVISSQLNQSLFGGTNSVGHTLNLDGHDYLVVGVTADWNPQPRFYDVNNNRSFADAPDFYLPFTRAVDMQSATTGNNNCFGSTGRAPGWDSWLHSECDWVSLWLELPNAAAVTHYKSYLEGYVAEQTRGGRFRWTGGAQLFDLVGWLDHEQVVPPETRVSMMVALGFLLVCLVNTVGLLLAKFMRRAGEIGVRRALGASRRQIYVQFLIEAWAIGVAGGLLGLLLTGVGVFGIGLVFEPAIARLAQVNLTLVGLTLLVSMAATVVAALYPTWRAAHVQPAWQLKSN
ncbi:ABC transporter permease [Rhodanobacter sp. L36]|uniref:ABC transporter permease n=1 Tax=Rhodanobacter sp. L36 TaxID=1747221 RepID=UPI00131E9DDB|nr:ABC transporter permease [Rhodanobacter sp. L36]